MRNGNSATGQQGDSAKGNGIFTGDIVAGLRLVVPAVGV